MDTERRVKALEEKGLYFIGTGVSGGEEGALTGPSIMPGGSSQAWPSVKPIFQAIAAKVEDGTPCCDWVRTTYALFILALICIFTLSPRNPYETSSILAGR